ncbi:hypothetical protein J4459_00160 [Candidatus Woesearchaeota archaeon]|nr:hypothetical protein [Candidatus Woesearchaeota archaeon]
MGSLENSILHEDDEIFYGEVQYNNPPKRESDLVSLLGIGSYVLIRFYDGFIGIESFESRISNGILSGIAITYSSYTEGRFFSLLGNATLAIVLGDFAFATGVSLRNHF